jgi:hypothetical protein
MHPSLQWFTLQTFAPRIEIRRGPPRVSTEITYGPLTEDGGRAIATKEIELPGESIPVWTGYDTIEADPNGAALLHLPHPDRYHPDMRVLIAAQRGELARDGKAKTACGLVYELRRVMVYEGDKRARCPECVRVTDAALLEHEAIREGRLT